jgi:hypothetical protein
MRRTRITTCMLPMSNTPRVRQAGNELSADREGQTVCAAYRTQGYNRGHQSPIKKGTPGWGEPGVQENYTEGMYPAMTTGIAPETTTVSPNI